MGYDGSLRFDTKIDSSGFQQGTNKLSSIIKGFAGFEIIKKGMQMVASSIDDAVSRYDTLNRFPKVLQNMGFGADEASAATQKLSDGVQGLPTKLDDVVTTAQRLTLLSKNLDMATDTTLALNNAFLASNASTDAAKRGTEQYIKMLSTGKVDSQIWLTLQETMAFALDKTAEAFGFAGSSAQDDLLQALKDGNITVTQFNDKLIELNAGVGGFAEMAQTSTGGIGTAWENLQTTIVRGTAYIIEAIDEGFSQTRFQSIENLFLKAKEPIFNTLKSVGDIAGFVAKNFDILLGATIALSAAFAATKGMQAWNKAAAEARRTAELARISQQDLTLAVSKSDVSKLALTASTKKQAAAEAKATAEAAKAKAAKLQQVAVEKSLEAAKAKEAKALATGTELTKAKTASVQAHVEASNAQTIATIANQQAVEADTKAKKLETIAQNEQNVSMSLGTAVIGYLTGSITLHELATIAATAATTLFNMALKALPFVGIAAAVAGLAALSKKLNSVSEETEELKNKTEQLAESLAEIEQNYQDATQEMEVQAIAAKGLINDIKALTDANGKAGDNAVAVKAKIQQLNGVIQNSGIYYDEVNSKVEGLTDSTDAYVDSLQWVDFFENERAKHISLIEKRAAADENLTKIKKKLIELEVDNAHIQQTVYSRYGDTTYAVEIYTREYQLLLDTLADAEQQYNDVEDAVIAMDKAMEPLYAEEEAVRLEEHKQAVAELAEQYGVSAESIQADLDALGITTEEWVSKQDAALANYENSVKERTSGVINSFKEIPPKFDQTAEEMLEILKNNKEQYARWEQNMEEITRQLGPTAAAEFGKLGPEANSAMEEILNSADLLDEYRDVFGVKIDAVTGTAIEDWHDPDFIGAPSDALDISAQKVESNPALLDANTKQADDSKKVIIDTLSEPELLESGSDMIDGIAEGVESNPALENAATENVNQTVAAVLAAIEAGDFPGMGGSIVDKIAEGVLAKSPVLADALTSVINNAAQKAQGAMSSAVAAVQSAAPFSMPVNEMQAFSATINEADAKRVSAQIDAMPTTQVAAYTQQIQSVINTVKSPKIPSISSYSQPDRHTQDKPIEITLKDTLEITTEAKLDTGVLYTSFKQEERERGVRILEGAFQDAR